MKQDPSTSRELAQLRQMVEESGYFDPEWYCMVNNDVEKSGLDPLDHFCRYGDRERRSPGPKFDGAAYIAAWPDAAKAGFGPFEHYLRVGRDADRPAPAVSSEIAETSNFRRAIYRSGLFEPDWYLEKYPDVRHSDLDLLTHFAVYGAKEGRDPGPNFSSLAYRLVYSLGPDEIPIEHYLLKKGARGLESIGGSSYEIWLSLFDQVDAEDRDLMRRHADDAAFPDLEIVHVFDALACRDADLILTALSDQAFERWTASILFAGDVGATDREAVAARAARDPRIRVEPLRGQPVLELNEGGAVLLICGCVRLTPHAAYLLLETLSSEKAEFAYSDHDHFASDGRRRNPVFKPVFSPEYLRNRFYIGPCVLVRAAPERRELLIRIIEDLRNHRCDELSDALLNAPRTLTAHTPFPLYSIQEEALDLERRPPSPRSIAKEAYPLVSVIVATRDRIELLRDCIDSLESKTLYPRDRLEIVVVDNGSTTKEAKLCFAELRRRAGYKVVADAGDFNFARLYNYGARKSRGEVLILLNNDTTVIDPRWIEKIVAQCLQPDVGCVGAKLLYADGAIQHAGCTLGVAGLAAHRHVGKKPESVAAGDATRELAAVTGACLGVRREIFDLVGGLDETLRAAFNDTRLCLSCLERGLRNIYISEPLLHHLESKSRGLDATRRQLEQRDRESIYTRQKSPLLFQNDPYYSPNLSVELIDELAFPPRRVKPWRHFGKDRPPRVMLLSSTHAVGSGVALVLNLQAQSFARSGFDVIVAGPRGENELAYEGCRRIHAATPLLAANLAVRENVDCVIVHTPPFFSITQFLGEKPIVCFFDYGEPNPEFFSDREAREAVDWEKRYWAPLAKRVIAISRTIRDQSLYREVSVLRLGNTHLASWSPQWRERRDDFRSEFGWTDKLVVLTAGRFWAAERRYKGVDKYAQLLEELWFAYPDTQGKVVFLLAGRGGAEDVEEMEERGLVVFPNVSDRIMAELFAAADLYVSFSKWEGYNLGIGQALAMGLPVIASDIEAHREFDVFTTNDIRVAMAKLHEHFVASIRGEAPREPVLFDWSEPLAKLVSTIRADLGRPATTAPLLTLEPQFDG